jgi:putative transposase
MRYRFTRYDRIAIRGMVYRWESSDGNGHLLRRHDELDIVEGFTHEGIQLLMRNQEIRIDRNWFLASKAGVRQERGTTLLSDLSAKERHKVFWRQEYCDRFLRLKELDGFSLSDASMRTAISNISAALEKMRQTQSGRCGTEGVVLNPPSPGALRDWLNRYERAGYDPMALKDGYGDSGNRVPRYNGESYQLAREVCLHFASTNKPTKAMIWKHYEIRLANDNERRAAAGETLLAQIGRRTFEKLVTDVLQPYQICAGREGMEAARRKFAIVNGGLHTELPLERVEMDEWNVSLQTLLVSAGVWTRMTSQQKAAVERKRTWLSAIIDKASRCVLALRLLDAAPSSASAIAALEMAVSDKSALAEVSGALTPWDMHGNLQQVAMDSGAGLIAAETKACIHDLGGEPSYPPTGVPELRGTIERAFGTFQKQVVRYFPGQTFENVVAKGDYDAEGNACINIEEFNRTLVRYVVDVYHNTPHAGLAWETPRNAWLRLTAKYGVLPPPDHETRRHIFGIACDRRIGNRGIRVMGLYYQSAALQRLRHAVGQKPVRVRINRYDLSEISVSTKTGWLSVPPSVEGVYLCGVSYWEWIAAVRDLKRKNADTSKLSADIVNAAIEAIRATADMAVARAELGSPIIAREDLERLDRDLFRGFGFEGGGQVSNEDILGEDEGQGDDDQTPPPADPIDVPATPEQPTIPDDDIFGPTDSFGSEDDWQTEE